jgi:histidinol-phosphatase (PHP family)
VVGGYFRRRGQISPWCPRGGKNWRSKPHGRIGDFWRLTLIRKTSKLTHIPQQCRVTIPTAGVRQHTRAIQSTNARLEFCTHAVDTLEDIILEAIRQKFTSFALTEHMPRDHIQDLYPEEKHLMTADLFDTFRRYHAAALRLRAKYAAQISLLIGFETEFIRPESILLILGLQQEYEFDFVVGSIHHVRGIPIDYNSGMWEEAAEVCGGEEGLFGEYFDEQFELLRGVKPLVVGHFDVIRLWAPNRMVRLRQWAGVWDKVVRNIECVIAYGGAFELNSAAFRKGFDEPYPTAEIATVSPPLKTLFLVLGAVLTGGVGDFTTWREVCAFR